MDNLRFSRAKYICKDFMFSGRFLFRKKKVEFIFCSRFYRNAFSKNISSYSSPRQNNRKIVSIRFITTVSFS